MLPVGIAVMGDHVHHENHRPRAWMKGRWSHCHPGAASTGFRWNSWQKCGRRGSRPGIPSPVRCSQPDYLFREGLLWQVGKVNGGGLQQYRGWPSNSVIRRAGGGRSAPHCRHAFYRTYLPCKPCRNGPPGQPLASGPCRGSRPGYRVHAVRSSWLPFQPAEERKAKVRFPVEREAHRKGLALHAGLLDGFPVAE